MSIHLDIFFQIRHKTPIIYYVATTSNSKKYINLHFSVHGITQRVTVCSCISNKSIWRPVIFLENSRVNTGGTPILRILGSWHAVEAKMGALGLSYSGSWGQCWPYMHKSSHLMVDWWDLFSHQVTKKPRFKLHEWHPSKCDMWPEWGQAWIGSHSPCGLHLPIDSNFQTEKHECATDPAVT